MAVLRQLRRKAPLFVLGGGAGALFFANVVARNAFTDAQFIEWAYLISLTSFFFSFSLLGSEQMIVRSTTIGDAGQLRVPRRVLTFVVLSAVVFAAIYAALGDGRIFRYRLGILAVPTVLSISAIQVGYQMERARGRLLSAQIALNAWRVALLPFVIAVSVITGNSRAAWAVGSALVIGVGCAVSAFFRARPWLTFTNQESDEAKVFLPFMVSLGMMAALSMADRVALEKVHAPTEFAAYVYAATILTSPFSILASYVGFSEAVRYRDSYSRQQVRRDAAKVTALATLAVFAWAVLCYATRAVSGVAFDPVLWLLLGVLSVARCGYAILSAAIAIKGSPAAMYWVNVITAAGLTAYLYVAVARHASLHAIIAGYVGVWAVRWISSFLVLAEADSRVDADAREAAHAA